MVLLRTLELKLSSGASRVELQVKPCSLCTDARIRRTRVLFGTGRLVGLSRHGDAVILPETFEYAAPGSLTARAVVELHHHQLLPDVGQIVADLQCSCALEEKVV